MAPLTVAELIKLLSDMDPSMRVYLDVNGSHYPTEGIWVSQVLAGKDKGSKYVCLYPPEE